MSVTEEENKLHFIAEQSNVGKYRHLAKNCRFVTQKLTFYGQMPEMMCL